jgi:hypothetical protein
MRSFVDRGPTNGPNIKANAGFTGLHALHFAGGHVGDGPAYSYNRVLAVDIKVRRSTRLTYELFPELTGVRERGHQRPAGLRARGAVLRRLPRRPGAGQARPRLREQRLLGHLPDGMAGVLAARRGRSRCTARATSASTGSSSRSRDRSRSRRSSSCRAGRSPPTRSRPTSRPRPRGPGRRTPCRSRCTTARARR